MDARVVRGADLRRVPWANGNGWTREIARSPGAGPWSWRLSIADVDRSAAFSTFPGVERELVLLRGNGLTLRFADGEDVTLRSTFDRIRFPGDRAVFGGPLDGPTEQLNVMWRPDSVDTEVMVLGQETTLDLVAGRWWAIHSRDGTVELDSDHEDLGPGDTMIVAAGTYDESIRLTVAGSALAVRIDPMKTASQLRRAS